MKTDQNTVVLLSGGIDSLVCAELARREDALAGCVFVDYGHPAQVPEGWKAFAYCGQRRVPLKVVHCFGLDLGDMGLAAGARVVPGRNAILLACAANAVGQLGGQSLTIGANAVDAADYPDCRREFLVSMSRALSMPVIAPLIADMKTEVIAKARELGLSRDDAWACYTAGPEPCSACPSCVLADAAWSSGP
jgi:7-cyano-7-deazaguanine synthase